MNQPNIDELLPKGKRLVFVQAGWHSDIVEQSRLSFLQHMKSAGIGPTDIDLVKVPGSFEIPLQCKMLAKTGRYQAIIAAGFIVDGGIYRHDFVAASVLDGLMEVQLELEVPVLSVVLTPHNFIDQPSHREFFKSHFNQKGKEAAQACIQVLVNQSKYLELTEAA